MLPLPGPKGPQEWDCHVMSYTCWETDKNVMEGKDISLSRRLWTNKQTRHYNGDFWYHVLQSWRSKYGRCNRCNVVKTILNNPIVDCWWFIPPIYGEGGTVYYCFNHMKGDKWPSDHTIFHQKLRRKNGGGNHHSWTTVHDFQWHISSYHIIHRRSQ